MPHLRYFDSMAALAEAVRQAEPQRMSAAMAEANRTRVAGAHGAWDCLMRQTFPRLAQVESRIS